MDIDDAKLFAWLDGELDAAQAAEVAVAVAADPKLTRMVERHRAFGMRLRETFETVAAAPLPGRLANAISPPPAPIVDIASHRQARAGWTPLPQWAAMAATLAVGIFVGATLIDERGASPVAVRGGTMVAAAALGRALDRQLASAGDVEGLRIGVTFRDSAGSVCRSFIDQQSSGLACRDGTDWRLRGLFAAPGQPSGDYRMATGTDPNLAALIDLSIAGDAFDAQQEQAARGRGWR